MTQPRYPSPVHPAQAVQRLVRAAATEHHEFWPCSVSLTEGNLLVRERLHGPRRVTDAYLLALAVSRSGRYVTLDHPVPVDTVTGAQPRT